jgi:hypothetical protein
MKQTFDFGNIKNGDRIRLHGIVAEYTETMLDENENEDGHGNCFVCAYKNEDCTNIPCNKNHIWEKISEASWKEGNR